MTSFNDLCYYVDSLGSSVNNNNHTVNEETAMFPCSGVSDRPGWSR